MYSAVTLGNPLAQICVREVQRLQEHGTRDPWTGMADDSTFEDFLRRVRAGDEQAAAEVAGFVRGHWGIENGLHWVLDAVFGEDRSRVREGNAGANLAIIRRVAVALLRRAPGKGSSVTRRLKAGWDDGYLLQVLQGITACIVR